MQTEFEDDTSEIDTPNPASQGNDMFQFQKKNPEDLNEFDFDNMESDSSVYEDRENNEDDRLDAQDQILALISFQKKKDSIKEK